MDRATADLIASMRAVIVDHLEILDAASLDVPAETLEGLGADYCDFAEIAHKIEKKTGIEIDDAHPALAAGYEITVAALVAHVLMLKALS